MKFRLRLRNLALLAVALSLCLATYFLGKSEGRMQATNEAVKIPKNEAVNQTINEVSTVIVGLIRNRDYLRAAQLAESLKYIAASDAKTLNSKCMQSIVDDFNLLLDREEYDACLVMATKILADFPEFQPAESMVEKARLAVELEEKKDDGNVFRLLRSISSVR